MVPKLSVTKKAKITVGVAEAEWVLQGQRNQKYEKNLPSCEPVMDRLDPGNLKHGDVSKQSPCEAVTSALHPDSATELLLFKFSSGDGGLSLRYGWSAYLPHVKSWI